ncbi:3-(cis-5,6-dihydroxycyclohexa-1,3-dien-1-yl)propanoate dehydrogenase [Mycobacterium montefiorense]|uniref:3-(Cis-5,6-dihydroxycyclohexa-1, 3-dien-1-yl)propanoate dehydrogenase n=1 Tax=Mycobacterium montefiorense TaxID=154654 RepID=A0AA37PTP1_9MYCO|nr:3-(cis-5,6-dihydroxycyclohexa-1,3-dien-1-yl)propanoate dehydrogenase [Mycobacterium montefiorense]GBG38212.1 3-(cis-5,6-dihydroxycyclohexa-1, 3-dien-1-yl)propanoate dehydrogenase [Mycobacterium montefiorense]GKU37592.1 3-(cis-5,6-dihydroxycyclohexa-1, 3-dien-1-yl)propanoate dehydrogenase [Mycobacterium montefiorense]GKU41285.1 3-(cis-5,6-dihydroxycyclohexa-1, 3-dien-1-yl)propanoate dehydrogenase [Mycobacterium montefiorense]GKU44492.1 3-(cis-5,6-dihydroxycyclohexa-1, 3-dien-1-yl)propanoate d
MTAWLDGKRALVVGGGSGIGRAVVEAFLAEGARVAVLERDPQKCKLLRAQLPEIRVVEGDAITGEANHRAVTETVDAFGGLDILVNCVGVFDFYQGVADLDADNLADAFDEMFRTNVLSHLQSVKAAVPALRDGAEPSIVLTESASSYHPGRGGVLYVSSKFAVRGLVASLAHELAPQIRVNGVAPGGTVNTDLRGLTSLGLNDTRLDDYPNRARDVAARTPLNVALSGADHAWSFVFLASGRSRGITGETIHPDGGFGIGTPKVERP